MGKISEKIPTQIKPFAFKVLATLGQARAGEIKTPHGIVATPMFMPVGTQASVKSLSPEDLKNCGVQIILGGNTYHMMLSPGIEVIKKAGGMHKFMAWDGPMLTDSGGFQLLSLASKPLSQRKFSQAEHCLSKANKKSEDFLISSNFKITNRGVYFKSLLDGSSYLMTPEKSIQIQKINGADIIMAFDQPIEDKASKEAVKKAVWRTNAWLLRSLKAWKKNHYFSFTTGQYQALFGIIQGGIYKDLRRESAKSVLSYDLPGVALGGETIGFNMKKTAEIIGWLADLLPEDKPRYCMGLGRDPQDIITAVSLGIDLFDCVAPTRLARNGSLYSGKLVFNQANFYFKSEFPKGRFNLANARFKFDLAPIDENCDCLTCRQGFSRSYLRHLFKSRELLYYRLASLHNVRFMIRLCEQLRSFILKNKLS